MAKFSVIVPHYQGTQTDEELKRCMDSLDSDLCEVLLYHDGPLQRKCAYDIIETDKRYNDWGHSLRDMGIKKATGEYIIHLNADNLIYPKALDKLSKEIEKSKEDIYILPVRLMNIRIGEDGELTDELYAVTIKGTPKPGSIDAMQLVMKTSLWKEYGWYDTSMNSDGEMYERFCKEHSYKNINILIGEHY